MQQRRFHHLYHPGVDYVPLEGDLTDLGAKLDAAVTTPDKSAAMAARWLARGRDVLSMECVLEYVAPSLLHSDVYIARTLLYSSEVVLT